MWDSSRAQNACSRVPPDCCLTAEGDVSLSASDDKRSNAVVRSQGGEGYSRCEETLKGNKIIKGL